MKYLSFSLVFCLSLLSLSALAQEEEFGLASYYSDGFQGRSTAYGDTYDKDELTCAHKRYPYGTMLRVTRLDNKRSVNVKVIDKGPFIKGRVVDLSRRAAEVLGIIDMGPVEVKVERLGSSSASAPAEVVRTAPEPAPIPEAMDEPAPTRITTPAPAETRTEPEEELTERRPSSTTPTPAPAKEETATPARETQSTVVPSNTRFSPVGDDFSPYGLYRITLEKPDEQAGFGVQVASLSNYENVLKQVASLQAKWFDNVLVSIEPGENGVSAYKVILGPFEDQKSASRYQQDLVRRYKIRGFVVNLSELSY